MKNKILFFAIIAMLVSCTATDEVAPSFLEIDGVSKDLTVGKRYDNGTNEELTYRSYDLTLMSTETNPSDFIQFTIRSTSTTRLQEGVYTYSYYANEPGLFTNAKVGNSLKYDASNIATSGTKIFESSYDYTGTITVSMSDEVYKFVFDLTATDDDKTFVIKGEYNKLLEEGYVYLK